MVANLGAAFLSIARVSPGGRAIELDGVSAAVMPASPERSVINCVTYSDADALGAALDRLAEEYDDAGVRAWTVWVPEPDREAAELLGAAGHVLDAQPPGMVANIDELDLRPAELDLMEPDMAVAGRINDAAYGLPGDFERVSRTVPPEPGRLYMARADGVPACTVFTYEEDGECGVYLVATLPEAQGRGLAGALMAHALLEARERGCTTTSLQSSARGRPVYARLGYREIGVVQMWERRQPV